MWRQRGWNQKKLPADFEFILTVAEIDTADTVQIATGVEISRQVDPWVWTEFDG